MVSLPIVLLIFISSNNPQDKQEVGFLSTTTPPPERGFADSGKPSKEYQGRVNDLTTSTFKFPEEGPRARGKAPAEKKIIREKVVPDEEGEKSKTPVPLYSLVKNECGDGYALDENGVCQKTITLRGGKKLESERRKRDAGEEWPGDAREFFKWTPSLLGEGRRFREYLQQNGFAAGMERGRRLR